jgi:integrase
MLLEKRAHDLLPTSLTLQKAVAEAKDIAKQFDNVTATPLTPEHLWANRDRVSPAIDIWEGALHPISHSKDKDEAHLNELAPKFSKSVLARVRVYFNSMLDEAVELEMLVKNPAGKLSVPRSRKRKADKYLTPEQIPLILFHVSDRDRLIICRLLVLGLRPGELFALRWNDKDGNSLRIDSSVSDGVEVETKTEGSDAAVWLPASISTELEFWREKVKDPTPGAFIFPSSRNTAINTNNFLFRVLKDAGKKAGIDGVTHQMLRRTCSTYMGQTTSVKDVQANLRHFNAKTTLDHYIKSVARERKDCCGVPRSSAKIRDGTNEFMQLNPTFSFHLAASCLK